MIKYIAYCRKSTDEKEKQVLSIESQIEELKEFAAKEKLHVVCFLTESRTAKNLGRPVFEEVIQKIEKGEANAILSWHPDRLARNSVDGGKLIYLLDTGKLLDLKFPTFWFDNTPQGKFMLSIAFGQSKYYVDNLSENVKRGNRQKLRKGILPNKAPYGYLNEPRLRTIEVDPIKSKIVKKAFELFAKGESSFANLARFFQKFGITRYSGKMLHLDTVKRILSNKFYIGVINFGGETYEGTHKLFIPSDIFEKVQKILEDREHPKNNKHNFTFLGLARCAECGCAITAEVKHKCYPSTRGNVDYIYYRCTKKRTDCSQNYLREELVELQLRAIVTRSALPDSWAKLWLERLDKEGMEEKRNNETSIFKFSSDIQEIDQKLDRLLEGYLDQIVDPQMYQQKKNELVELKIKCKEKIVSISKNGSEWLGLMKEFIEVAADAAKIARAKHNGEELSFFAKKVGSDYSLLNRRLFCVYKQGFAALATVAGVASAIPNDPFSPKLWVRLGSNQGPLSYQESALPLSHAPKRRNLLYNNSMENLTTLVLKLPRNTEVTPEAAQTFLASLTQLSSISFLEKLRGKHKTKLSLEILVFNQQIQFQVTCSNSLVSYVETQIQSSYPLVVIQKQKEDPAKSADLIVWEARLKDSQNYPLATYTAFKDIDPISSILSVLAKSEPGEVTLVQYALAGTPQGWRASIEYKIEKGIVNKDGIRSELPDREILREKILFPAFNTTVRIASNKSETLKELSNAFEVVTRPNANSIKAVRPNSLLSGSPVKALLERRVSGNQILNIAELATLWHLPSEKIKTPTIAWGVSVLSEPPENLPAAITASEDEKREINFFAKTVFKNKETIFGIKNSDRRRHIWCIGKSGTGKSTLIANMAIDDFKKDRGVAVIDPHGDLIEILLDYVPRSRINDVVYFNPADRDYPIIINSLEVTNKEEAELVVSGIVSIFYKIFGHSWGPRLEYILRNTLLTLTEIPNTTLSDVVTILTDKSFRNRLVAKIEDSVLKHFWTDEYERWKPETQQEVISPILNKVGQFVSSPLIRRVIGSPKSSIHI